MLEGTLTNDECWAVIYTIDDGDDWTQEEALRKANPNFDISVDRDFLLARQQEAIQSAHKQAVFRTKHLNEWIGAKTAWMNMVKWGQCSNRAEIKDLEGQDCVIAVDLASKVDIASVVTLFPPNNQFSTWQVFGHYFAPEGRVNDSSDSNAELYRSWQLQGAMTLTEGDSIDFSMIKEHLINLAKQFNVLQVAYDPFQATQFAQEMAEAGLTMVQVGATVKNFSEPMKEIEKLVYDKKLAHGNCPAMTWMMSNVVAKTDAKDNIYPRKERNELKIDGPVALIMAMSRAILVEQAVSLDDILNSSFYL